MTVEELEEARVQMFEKPTTELCPSQHSGHRCGLHRGHPGEHESMTVMPDQEPRRWR